MAKIPSIALIPSGYKATKIYSVLPTDGSADLTFDRGTSDDQTRVNSNGLIEDVDQDVPRLDYSDGGCPSLLLEPATTNLITHSEEFDNAAWGKVDATISANAVISPKGDLTADKLVESATTAFHFTDFAVVLGANPYTFTCFMKSAERTSGSLFLSQSGNNGAVFDLDNGVVTSVSGTGNTASIEDYGNGWYRCSVTNDGTADVVNSVRIGVQNGAIASYVGDGTSGIYIWGAQLEEQSYATSYVPSLGTSGVRAAETASKTGLSSYINSTEGVLYAEISALADDLTNRTISLSDGTTNNTVRLQYLTISNEIWATITNIVSGGNQAILKYKSVDITSKNKVALKYKENDFALYVNGLLVDIDSLGVTFTANTLSSFQFDRGNGNEDFYGKTKDLRVYNEALSDLELARLTGFGSFSEMASYLSYS